MKSSAVVRDDYRPTDEASIASYFATPPGAAWFHDHDSEPERVEPGGASLVDDGDVAAFRVDERHI